jgi:DNA-3-methyladenine glycosylase I
MITRCAWVPDDPIYQDYHDLEWGVPVHDDQVLFEFLVLEGAQAGLSWSTILHKRQNYRLAFDYFDPEKVARYDDAKFLALMSNSGLVRNRLKIQAAITNARAFLVVVEEFGSFDKYVWQFVDCTPTQNRWQTLADIPSRSPVSDALSKDLILRGFKFVGSTICYAHMQATGMVNDHTIDCFRFAQLGGMP